MRLRTQPGCVARSCCGVLPERAGVQCQCVLCCRAVSGMWPVRVVVVPTNALTVLQTRRAGYVARRRVPNYIGHRVAGVCVSSGTAYCTTEATSVASGLQHVVVVRACACTCMA